MLSERGSGPRPLRGWRRTGPSDPTHRSGCAHAQRALTRRHGEATATASAGAAAAAATRAATAPQAQAQAPAVVRARPMPPGAAAMDRLSFACGALLLLLLLLLLLPLTPNADAQPCSPPHSAQPAQRRRGERGDNASAPLPSSLPPFRPYLCACVPDVRCDQVRRRRAAAATRSTPWWREVSADREEGRGRETTDAESDLAARPREASSASAAAHFACLSGND